MDGVSRQTEELQALLDRVWSVVTADQTPKASDPGAEEAWLHKGFLSAYDSVRSALLHVVATAMEPPERGAEGDIRRPAAGPSPTPDQGARWRVLVTGHSLGGALATVCAYDLARRPWHGAGPRPRLTMYSYGSPRVGNRRFAQARGCAYYLLRGGVGWCFEVAPCS